MMKSALKVAVMAAGVAAAPASAAYLFTVQDTAGSVTITGSGSIDLIGLTMSAPTATDAGIQGRTNTIVVGANIRDAVVYRGVNGPASFGTGSFVSADRETGATFGLANGVIFFNRGYVSGSQFGTSTATLFDQSIASLGLVEGEYVYRFGSGANADTITVRIGNPVAAAIPEPATWAMMIGGFGLVGGAMRRRRTSITLA